MNPPAIGRSLLYLDPWVAVADKTAGEIVHPGWARGEATTMARVRDLVGRHVHPLHRLDRGTSGAVLFALDRATAATLSEALARGAVRKRYLALVRGVPPEGGLVDHPVRRGEAGRERIQAVTRFERLGIASEDRCSLVLAEPLTGRLHQLRRHFKHLSHPVVGDVNYGDGRVNRAFRARWGLHRLALHALSLELLHPVTGEPLRIVAPLPDDLFVVLERLGLRAALPPEAIPAAAGLNGR
jgi:tRNA pseudouridine65 synthase